MKTNFKLIFVTFFLLALFACKNEISLKVNELLGKSSSEIGNANQVSVNRLNKDIPQNGDSVLPKNKDSSPETGVDGQQQVQVQPKVQIQPAIISELLFGEPFENLTKKYGDFEVDKRDVVACKTPPKCDYYYFQKKMLNNCQQRVMGARADYLTGKTKWIYLSFGGVCNGELDIDPVSKLISKNDPKPDYLFIDEKGNATGMWEKGGIYFNIWALCVDPSSGKIATNFLDCKLRQINIRNEDTIKPEFKVNNFKFSE